MNKKLKKVLKILNRDVSLSTYLSGHSRANIAKRTGKATVVIYEGLGHESEETTQVCLDSFENDYFNFSFASLVRHEACVNIYFKCPVI